MTKIGTLFSNCTIKSIYISSTYYENITSFNVGGAFTSIYIHSDIFNNSNDIINLYKIPNSLNIIITSY